MATTWNIVIVVNLLALLSISSADLECPPALMNCSNGGDIDPAACGTKPGLSSYSWNRTTVCNCPNGYGGQGCEFVKDPTICTSSNLTLKTASEFGRGSMECRVDYTSKSKILNLVDHNTRLDIDLYNEMMNIQVQTRLKSTANKYTDVVELMSCTFWSCFEAIYPTNRTISCANKECRARPNSGIPILSLFTNLVNADKRPIVVAFEFPDEAGSVVASFQLQTFIYTLPLRVKCFAGFCG